MTTIRPRSSRLAGFLGIVALLIVTPHLLVTAFLGFLVGSGVVLIPLILWGMWLPSFGYYLLGSGQLDSVPDMTNMGKGIGLLFVGFYPVALVAVFQAAVIKLFTPKSRKTTVINVGALLLALGMLLLEGMPFSPLHSVKSRSISKAGKKIAMPVPGKAEFIGCLVTAALLFQLSAVLRPPASGPVSATPLPKPPPPAPGA